MPIQPVGKKLSDSEVNLALSNPAVLDALQKGSVKEVHELLTENNITAIDFEEFATKEHAKYMSIIKPYTDMVFSTDASVPPPNLDMDFHQHRPENYMSAADFELSDSFFTGKAMSMLKQEGDGESKGPELAEIRDFLEHDWPELDQQLNNAIVDMQLGQMAESKNNELQQDLDRIVAKIKSGEITDPTVLLLAVTKFTVGKYNLEGVMVGNKMLKENQRQMVATKMVQNDETSPGVLYEAQAVARETGLNMTNLSNDLRRCMDYSMQVMNMYKSFKDSYEKFHEDIIRKFSASGA